MKIEYDQKKNQRNIDERGLSFEYAHLFHWSTAEIVQDTRNDYPEPRFIAFGYIGTTERLHVIVFTPIDGGIRVISLRKANKREVSRYESR